MEFWQVKILTMSKVKLLILSVLVMIAIGSYLYYYQWLEEEFMPVRECIISISLEQVSNPIYFKAKKWGIAGNHEEIVLSLSNAKVFDKESDYIFYTDEIYFKSDKKEKISVYAPESSISEPKNKFPNVTVEIIRLKNASEIKEYSSNYKKYELDKIVF